MKKWEDLPLKMQNEEVKYYYNILEKHCISMVLKRMFDVVVSVILLIILSPVLLLISVAIKLDSKGTIMFRQDRVTRYGKKFKILKFRTMVTDAEKVGTQVTVKGDSRITRVGRILRKYRLDEFPQLINILNGDMTFVGTRPEVNKYVEYYTPAMYATLLLPAGLTSRTSIEYKDEEKLLENVEDADRIYVEVILKDKMFYNLKALENFNFWEDIKTMVLTVVAVIR